jgi:hypothetical protein
MGGRRCTKFWLKNTTGLPGNITKDGTAIFTLFLRKLILKR